MVEHWGSSETLAITFTAVAGQTYYVQIGGFRGATALISPSIR